MSWHGLLFGITRSDYSIIQYNLVCASRFKKVMPAVVVERKIMPTPVRMHTHVAITGPSVLSVGLPISVIMSPCRGHLA